MAETIKKSSYFMSGFGFPTRYRFECRRIKGEVK